MPYYFARKVHICYDERCSQEATGEVRDPRNDLVGYFCDRHGQATADSLNANTLPPVSGSPEWALRRSR